MRRLTLVSAWILITAAGGVLGRWIGTSRATDRARVSTRRYFAAAAGSAADSASSADAWANSFEWDRRKKVAATMT